MTKKKSKKTKKAAFRYSRPFWSKHWLPCLILFIMAVGIYIQSAPYEFVLDDQLVLSDNDFTKSGIDGLKKIFTTEGFTGYFGEQKDVVAGARYRPLSMAMFAVEYEFFGMKPMGYHLVNVLLYALLGILMYRVALIYLPKFKAAHALLSLAFLSTLLYIVHPVHTECVANIKGRDEILSMLGSLGTLYLVARYIASKNVLWIVLSALCFFASLFAKENTLTFLAVVPLALYFFTREKLKTYAMVIGSLLISTIAYLIIRFKVIGYLLNSQEITDVMNNPFIEMTGSQKSATICYTLGEYLRLLFFPLELTHDYYPYHVPIMNWSDAGPVISLILYIGMAVIGLWALWKRRRMVGFSIAYYFATLSIVSNVFFPIGTFMNERFLFMPSWGYTILLVYLLLFWLPQMFRKNKAIKPILLGLFGVYFLFFTVRSVVRVPAWKDPLSLNSAAIKVSKNSARANVFMGTALYKKALDEPDRDVKQQMMNEVEAYIDQALSILPNYNNANKMKAGVLAQHYKLDGDIYRLLTGFKQVARRRPDNSYMHEYLSWLNDRGRHDGVLAHFYIDVGYNDLYINEQFRNLQYAQKFLLYGLEVAPDDPRILYALYRWNTTVKRPQKAEEYLQRALSNDPDIVNKMQ